MEGSRLTLRPFTLPLETSGISELGSMTTISLRVARHVFSATGLLIVEGGILEKWSQFLIHKIGSHMEEDARLMTVQEVGKISSLPAEFWNRWVRQVIIYDPGCEFEASLIGDLAASKPKPWHPLAHLDLNDFSPSTREAVIQLSGPGMDVLQYKLANPIAQKIRDREYGAHAVHLLCTGDASGVKDCLIEAKFVFSTSDNEWVLDISDYARGKTIDDLLAGLKNSKRAWVQAVLNSESLQLSINYMGTLHEVPRYQGSKQN